MNVISPQHAREIYERAMKKELYSCIGENNLSLKRYVDSMYKREYYYSVFIGIEVSVFMVLVFIFVIIPKVEMIMP